MITGHHFTDEQIPTQLGVTMFSHFHVSAYWDIRFRMLANICSLSLYCCVRNSFLFWARWQCNIKWEITLIRTFKIIWAYCDFYVLFEWILEINWLTRKFELLEYYELLQYLWFIMGRLQMQEMLKHIISRSRKFEISYRCIKGWCPKIYWRYIVGRSQ